MSFRSLVCCATLLCATACDKKDQHDAEQAQRDAETKARDAQQEANDKIAEAKREAEKAAGDAQTARADAKASLQKDIDAVERKVSFLKERGSAAKGNAQKNYVAAQGEIEKRRSTLQADFGKLDTKAGAAWDATRATVEQDIAAFKASVDSLESTLSAK